MSRPLEVDTGSVAPPFTLSTPHGVEVDLAVSLLAGPVLLEFIRGTWDPDTRHRLRVLEGVLEQFQERRSRIFVVVCEQRASVVEYLRKHPGRLTLLVDEERRVARGYGVLRRFSLPVWNVARPASFLVDRCGFVRFAYRAPLSIHAAKIEEILAVLVRI